MKNLLSILVIASILFFGCKKDEETTDVSNTSTTIANDTTVASDTTPSSPSIIGKWEIIELIDNEVQTSFSKTDERYSIVEYKENGTFLENYPNSSSIGSTQHTYSLSNDTLIVNGDITPHTIEMGILTVEINITYIVKYQKI